MTPDLSQIFNSFFRGSLTNRMRFVHDSYRPEFAQSLQDAFDGFMTKCEGAIPSENMIDGYVDTLPDDESFREHVRIGLNKANKDARSSFSRFYGQPQ